MLQELETSPVLQKLLSLVLRIMVFVFKGKSVSNL
jgi:hypothetical protein